MKTTAQHEMMDHLLWTYHLGAARWWRENSDIIIRNKEEGYLNKFSLRHLLEESTETFIPSQFLSKILEESVLDFISIALRLDGCSREACSNGHSSYFVDATVRLDREAKRYHTSVTVGNSSHEWRTNRSIVGWPSRPILFDLRDEAIRNFKLSEAFHRFSQIYAKPLSIFGGPRFTSSKIEFEPFSLRLVRGELVVELCEPKVADPKKLSEYLNQGKALTKRFKDWAESEIAKTPHHTAIRVAKVPASPLSTSRI